MSIRERYSPENWNAVVLYNYVDVLMHGKLYPEAQKKGITDVFEFIKQLLKDHYAKQKIQISDFDGKLDRAIGDIRENDKLGIGAEITSYIINSNNKDEVRTPNYGISISDIEKQSLKDTIIFVLNRTVEIKRNNQQFIKFDLTLSYHPKAPEDEKWRPIDNGTYTIDDKVGIYSGKWIRLTRCLISFFSQLIYYINYDFELDASELWDYRKWSVDPIFEYKGKMLTIESSNKNDPQYKDAIKDGTSVRIYNEEYPNGYPDFRKMDPKERPILVED